MNAEPAQPWHGRLKLVWLLSHALTFPMAAVYFTDNSLPVPGQASGVAAMGVAVMRFVCAAIVPMIWIIAEAMLVMYRFPLSTRRAAMLVAGFYVQLAILLATGESISFAMFVSVYTTLAAAFACLLPLLIHVRRSLAALPGNPGSRYGIPAQIAIVLLALAPPATLLPVLRDGFARMSTMAMAWAIGIVVANTVAMMKELVGLSIFGARDPLEDEYGKAWERWAPATVILLILSVVAGVVVAGLRRSL